LPRVQTRGSEANGDARSQADWSGILNYVRQRIDEQVRTEGSTVVGILSPWTTCEEAYLFASWLKGLSPAVRLVLGPIPIVGEDDSYPKDWRGRPVTPPRFVIRAEKCPNRRGVEAVLSHFQRPTASFDSILADAREEKVKVAYVVHSGPADWLSADHSHALSNVPFLVGQQILPTELSRAAQVVLPGASFAEKDGSYVNYAGLAQMLVRSIRPPAEGYTDGRIFMELAGRPGLYNARLVRQEMSKQIRYFAPFAAGDLGEYGVRLEETGSREVQAVR
jgi:NADH-quinone oxidoreductase subunit G